MITKTVQKIISSEDLLAHNGAEPPADTVVIIKLHIILNGGDMRTCYTALVARNANYERIEWDWAL